MSKITLENWTSLDLVKRQAARYGDRVFCTFDDGRALTFEEFELETNVLASAFAELGVEPGDRVLALAYNSRDFLLAMIAVQKRGAIFVPINTELRGDFLDHQIRIVEPRVVVVDAALRPTFDSVSIADLSIETTVVIGGEAPPLLGTRGVSFGLLAETSAKAVDVLPASPQDICMIIFTSGTTGPSKGVLMPHAHCYLFGYGSGRALGMTEADRMFICMPFFHAMGLLIQFNSCLINGVETHIVRRFSATSWLEDVRQSKATITYALGVMPEFIYRQPPTDRDRDNDLRVVLAVPIGEDWGEAFEERFDLRLMQAYGMTECNLPNFGDLADPVMAGCSGYVVDDFFDVRVVDSETDEVLPFNEVGEIVVRPKRPSCFMAGYYRMPERTVEAWRNLWFHTGDAGRFDEKGRLFFIDRIKDCIRRRGENISAFEVEQVLNNIPQVAESAVIGVQAQEGGEEDVKACIVVQEGEVPDPELILDWCVERMPRFAVPRFIEFVTELDKTPTGKLRKQALRDAGVTDPTWDRESIGYAIRR
jgi:crotonobetaine/carnitine-CoA ligase